MCNHGRHFCSLRPLRAAITVPTLVQHNIFNFSGISIQSPHDDVRAITHRPTGTKFMGEYERAPERVHDGPLYVRRVGDETYYIVRNSNPAPDRLGKWMVTDSAKNFASGSDVGSYFLSSTAAATSSSSAETATQ